MARSNLNEAIYALSQTAEAFKLAGVLDPSEYNVLHRALWGIVLDREKAEQEKRAKELAEETSECL